MGILLFDRVKGLCPTTTQTPIKSLQVPPGEVWELKFVAVYNDSAESFAISVGILSGGKHLAFSLTAALATKSAVLPWPLPILGEGDILQCLATGSTSGGEIWLIYSGYRHKLGGTA